MDHSQTVDATTMQTPALVSYSLWQLVRYFLRLGTLGFGGPVALVRYRMLGATLVGLACIWPSFLMVVALGWLYTLYGGLAWMQAVFYGVGASVIGIVALSALKLTNRTIGRDPLLWGIYLVTALVTVLTQSLITRRNTTWNNLRKRRGCCSSIKFHASPQPAVPASGGN